MFFGNESGAMISSRVDDLAVGVTYSLVSLILCVVQLIMLHIFYFDEEFKKIPSYMIMMHLCVADIVQLIFHLFSGVFVVFQSTFHPWIEKLCGAFINTGCITYTPLTMLLAVSRFFAICCSTSAQSAFSKTATKVWISMIWLYGCCFFVCYISPAVTVTFDPSVYMWSHGGFHAKLVRDTEYYTALFELCVTATVYVATVITLAVKVRRTRERRATLKRYDIRILIQAMTISFFIGFVLFTWYSFDTYLIATKWTFFMVNMMWILNCGINPILYMLLNKTVRRKYILFIKVYMLKNAVIADSDLAALCAASGITHRTYRLTPRSSNSRYRPQSWSIRSSQRSRQSNNNTSYPVVIYGLSDSHRTISGGQ